MRVPDKEGMNPRAVSKVGEPSWQKTGNDVWKKEGEFGPEYLSLQKSLPGDRTDVVLKRPDANPKLIETFKQDEPPFKGVTQQKAREYVEEYKKSDENPWIVPPGEAKKAMKEYEDMTEMAELRALSKHSLEHPLTKDQYNRMMTLAKSQGFPVGKGDGQ
jgi:hypothetical protein